MGTRLDLEGQRKEEEEPGDRFKGFYWILMFNIDVLMPGREPALSVCLCLPFSVVN